jgi:hypothetical protein
MGVLSERAGVRVAALDERAGAMTFARLSKGRTCTTTTPANTLTASEGRELGLASVVVGLKM